MSEIEASHLGPEGNALLANANAVDEAVAAARPEEPSLPFGEWCRKNLFSSVFNSILTVIFVVGGLLIYRSLLNFIFSEERTWDAVRINLRALFSFALQSSQYIRIWFTLGVIMTLAGLSLGLMRTIGRGFSIKRVAMWFIFTGVGLVLGILLAQPAAIKGPDGVVERDGNGNKVRQSLIDMVVDRAWWWVFALIVLAIGFGLWYGFGEAGRRSTFVPAIPLGLGAIGFLVSTGWWYNWGHYGTNDEGLFAIPGRTVAMTTKLPWTVMWVILVGAYLLGRALLNTAIAGKIRAILVGSWLLLPFVSFFVILRDPDLDWAHVWSTDIPLALAFILGGGALLWVLTSPTIGEIGRLIAIALLGIAGFNWIAAFFGWYSMLQKVRISFLLIGLAALIAHNFAGEAKQRLRLVYGWMAVIAIVHYLITMINTVETIDAPGEGFAGGFVLSLYVSIFTMIFSFPLGVLLALGRTSRLPIFRLLSTAYIEVVRGVPLITILFFFTVFVALFLPVGMHLAGIAAAIIGFSMFSAAYLAENIRGGLQAVRQGQYEASDALGLTTAQRTGFIILPQALRVSIPPLVGMAIATYKETSLLSIVGFTDFTKVANSSIPGQTEFLGVKLEGLLFISLIYWIGSYAMSKYSQRLEKQLGVGER